MSSVQVSRRCALILSHWVWHCGMNGLGTIVCEKKSSCCVISMDQGHLLQWLSSMWILDHSSWILWHFVAYHVWLQSTIHSCWTNCGYRSTGKNVMPGILSCYETWFSETHSDIAITMWPWTFYLFIYIYIYIYLFYLFKEQTCKILWTTRSCFCTVHLASLIVCHGRCDCSL